MRFNRLKANWWEEPEIYIKKIRAPKHLNSVNPVGATHKTVSGPKSKIARFNHSRTWVRYGLLDGVDTGFYAPLYDLKAIALRYGFSANSIRYLRKYILPEPFDIVRRRSVNAHHWSHLTLLAFDTVLMDLEGRGVNQILKKYEDHISLIQKGSDYLHSYYAEKVELKDLDATDKFGVQWLT